jgi:acetylglutamate kinase
MNGRPQLTLVKIGGNILNDEAAFQTVLGHFVKIEGAKVLVHGGGRAATDLAERLDIPQNMIQGRRVTDEATLRVAVMVYAGLINKSIVAGLQARGLDAIGLTGADFDLLRARKRSPEPVDYGFVGDIIRVKTERLVPLIQAGIAPVLAPLTHDGEGQILNTNADSIAHALSSALSRHFAVKLIYGFEKNGVEIGSRGQLAPVMTFEDFITLKNSGVVSGGMIPKLENAFKALDEGVSEIVIGNARELPSLLAGIGGTRIIHGR